MLLAVLCGLGCICIVLLLAIGFLFFKSHSIKDGAEKEDTVVTEEQSEEPKEAEAETDKEPLPEAETGLEIHFIDIGQGDATLIKCDGYKIGRAHV